MIVVCAIDRLRSAIISTKSRRLSLKRRYQRTHRMMTSRAKWRPSNSSATAFSFPIDDLSQFSMPTKPIGRRHLHQSLSLYVLRQRQGDGAAFGWVGQHAHRLRQALDDLFRPGDPVPPSRDRPEAVIDRDGRVAERLDLLQARVGPTSSKDVAG